jgi:hypothetical protein
VAWAHYVASQGKHSDVKDFTNTLNPPELDSEAFLRDHRKRK